MFNKYRTEKDSKIIIARINTASKLMLRYTRENTFVPPHMYYDKSSSDAYKSSSLHRKPFWMGNINV